MLLPVWSLLILGTRVVVCCSCCIAVVVVELQEWRVMTVVVDQIPAAGADADAGGVAVVVGTSGAVEGNSEGDETDVRKTVMPTVDDHIGCC